MFLTLLSIAPALALAWVVAILVSLTVHEFAHALTARARGDRTAEWEGRLTLNPLSHIDWMGFFALLFMGFGWAKPVPYNPNNLRDAKWDQVRVALMGPISNVALAAIAALLIRVLLGSGADAFNLAVVFLFLLVRINLGLAIFNLLPIPPLDGSKLLIALMTHPRHRDLLRALFTYGPQVLMALVFVSLLTSFNAFFFVSIPMDLACDALMGQDCGRFFGAVLSGV